ncbi:hypothetical protein HA399_14430 [Cobetia sp. UIB-001]|uniref:hypothetical protein n=1 Tax=unclassified Cobetia TaxID=2609414 RepID=UPI0020BF51C2|nr:hypothetical protein [Cobetia sp. 1CM21F]MCK8069541.1 hypothetical protein [Cobetia sp. 1CM21F]
MEGKAQAALCCPACSGLKMEYQYHTPSADHLVHCQDCHEYVGMWFTLRQELAIQNTRIALLDPSLASNSLYRRVKSVPHQA